jgi:ABC-2 type transport system permease protein
MADTYCIIFFSGGGSGKMDVLTTVISQMNDGLLLTILVGAGAFIASSNAITSTAISREGTSMYFMKYIPMSMHKQLQAKSITGMIFSGISIVLLMCVGLFIGANVTVVIISLAIGLIVTAATSYAGLLIDVANPKLQWINEQQAIKQNLNVMLHMLVGVVFGAIAILPAAMLGTSLIVSALYCLVFFLLILLILRNRVNNRAAEKLIGMDV